MTTAPDRILLNLADGDRCICDISLCPSGPDWEVELELPVDKALPVGPSAGRSLPGE